MKRYIAIIILALLWLFATKAFTAEINPLAVPVLKPSYYDVARLHVDWDVNAKRFAIRLSLGYYEGTTFKETADFHKIIENIPAVLDDPNTQENEAKSADLAYTNFEALEQARDPKAKKLDVLILELIQTMEPKFAGTIVP